MECVAPPWRGLQDTMFWLCWHSSLPDQVLYLFLSLCWDSRETRHKRVHRFRSFICWVAPLQIVSVMFWNDSVIPLRVQIGKGVGEGRCWYFPTTVVILLRVSVEMLAILFSMEGSACLSLSVHWWALWSSCFFFVKSAGFWWESARSCPRWTVEVSVQRFSPVSTKGILCYVMWKVTRRSFLSRRAVVLVINAAVGRFSCWRDGFKYSPPFRRQEIPATVNFCCGVYLNAAAVLPQSFSYLFFSLLSDVLLTCLIRARQRVPCVVINVIVFLSTSNNCFEIFLFTKLVSYYFL